MNSHSNVILSACAELPRPSHCSRAERQFLPVVIPSESEGPGGRVERRPLLPKVWEASPRPGPSLTLGMTDPKFSRRNRVGWSASEKNSQALSAAKNLGEGAVR